MTQQFKTINRGWLKRQVEAGNIEAKCDISLTDDYAWDDANNFGKTGWLTARISRPRYEEYPNEWDGVFHRCVDHDFIEGMMNFDDYDFKTKSGLCYQAVGSDIIDFSVHSNLHYSLRLKKND